MKHNATWLAALAVGTSLLLGACATSGTGSGELIRSSKPAQAVPFAWKSTDGGITGTLTATLPGGAYSGRFVQVTRQTQSDAMVPMWGGWQPGWSDWPYWGYGSPVAFDATQFTTVYSGKVIANLSSPSGSLMRCRLHMLQPAQGMAGGGMGECQILNGATIQATF
jgi:hypothetical protein